MQALKLENKDDTGDDDDDEFYDASESQNQPVSHYSTMHFQPSPLFRTSLSLTSPTSFMLQAESVVSEHAVVTVLSSNLRGSMTSLRSSVPQSTTDTPLPSPIPQAIVTAMQTVCSTSCVHSAV